MAASAHRCGHCFNCLLPLARPPHPYPNARTSGCLCTGRCIAMAATADARALPPGWPKLGEELVDPLWRMAVHEAGRRGFTFRSDELEREKEAAEKEKRGAKKKKKGG